ncbi:MAG: Elongation factor Ts [Alphaproteobacteria bacterium MarineAlpha2_Bin1]|nr:MAG: Elongation factor Ts [Alphaproteobacteria bacterium MarineAlpha2_Bin1]
MTDISAKLVKELRVLTGAGMMDCKKALSDSNGNFDDAINWLRTKGLATAAKKSDRDAKEGLVCVKVKNNLGTIIEVNSETDFVARNDQFQSFVNALADLALEKNISLEELLKKTYPDSELSIHEKLNELVSTIGENLSIKRVKNISVKNGKVCSYIHNVVAPDLGRIGVLVGIEAEKIDENLDNISKQIAMHIAATSPISISKEDLSEDIIDKERNVYKSQAIDSGKPEKIIDKMVEGRLRKFFQEVCLYDQLFVIDNETKISDFLTKFSKENNNKVNISSFVRFQLGEEVTKE